MRPTLFTIPHALFEGWLLGAWLVLGLVGLVYLIWKHGWNRESLGFLPVYAIGALLIHFVLPRLEVVDFGTDGVEGPQGLAVRGYGLMMLTGMVAGVGLSILRGRQVGCNPDQIVSLCFWMIVSGIIGARLFYVIQKYDQFEITGPVGFVSAMLNMTQGGLVVYGSLIGAAIGAVAYLVRNGLPILKHADVLAPGLAIGLAIGRIGCLMNGCCYGGNCEIDQIAIRFPPGSPPYSRQLEAGELIGISAPIERVIGPDGQAWLVAEQVGKDSIADELGIQAADRFRIRFRDQVIRAIKLHRIDVDANPNIEVTMGSGEVFFVPIDRLPERANPIHPTQLYSAVNALLLCGLLWFYFPYRRRDGQVFALAMILYSITRFLLESVRRDELGWLGTPLTISQWMSLIVVVVGFVLFALGGKESGKPVETHNQARTPLPQG